METLSFVLGIASVVVIAIAIVAVYAFVKANKLEKLFEQNERQMDQVNERAFRDLNEQTSEIYRRITDGERSIYSHIDSRLDKLQNKKQLIKD